MREFAQTQKPAQRASFAHPARSKRIRIQPKLEIGAAGDAYEQEADRIADQVMRMPEPGLQRACACGGGCPRCQSAQTAHEQVEAPAQAKSLQTKSLQANDSAGIEAPPIVHEVLNSPGQPLDPATRAYMEPRLGHDFSKVRVHADARAAEAASSINARAFTCDRNIVFGAAEYSLQSESGRRLLAHELTHAMQQSSAKVQSKIQRQVKGPDEKAIALMKPPYMQERHPNRIDTEWSNAFSFMLALEVKNHNEDVVLAVLNKLVPPDDYTIATTLIPILSGKTLPGGIAPPHLGRPLAYKLRKIARSETTEKSLKEKMLPWHYREREMDLLATFPGGVEYEEKEQARVISPTAQSKEGAVTSAQDQLNKRVATRKKAIGDMLEELGPNPKSDSAKKRAEALKGDLAKTLETIIKEPDAPFLNKGLRNDIIKSARALDRQKLTLTKANEVWGKYDPIFAGQEVVDALGTNSLTPAELKALIAQESGDLTVQDVKGNIAGIAQMGSDEEKIAGGKKGDRKVPEKAIPLAAKLISRYVAELDKSLRPKPTGIDRKIFIMAAYNGGVNLIITAQREAIKMGRDGKTWQSLIEGPNDSPLHRAIEATYKAGKKEAKYKEVTEYVEKIYKRLPQDSPPKSLTLPKKILD